MSSGELRVVGPDGNEVPRDGQTLGEITVRGNVVMKGYFNDPGATAAAIKDGWFHSGDAAVVHRDGYVEIRDRFKDVIISGDELKAHVRGSLAHFKTPQWISVVDELPKTATGKVQKYVLRGGESGIARQ